MLLFEDVKHRAMAVCPHHCLTDKALSYRTAIRQSGPADLPQWVMGHDPLSPPGPGLGLGEGTDSMN